MAKPASSGGKVKWGRYVLLLILGLGIYHILSGPSGAINLMKLRMDNAGKARELDSLTQRKAELEIEKVRLEKDSAYMEQVARKELGMARPGEKVFRFMGPTGKGRADQGSVKENSADKASIVKKSEPHGPNQISPKKK